MHRALYSPRFRFNHLYIYKRWFNKFKNIRYMLRSPIIFYADFECLLENNCVEPTSKRDRETIFYGKPKPCSVAFFPPASFEGAPNFQSETYTGPNVCNCFFWVVFKYSVTKLLKFFWMRKASWLLKICWILQMQNAALYVINLSRLTIQIRFLINTINGQMSWCRT